jgi:hypothetical protein
MRASVVDSVRSIAPTSSLWLIRMLSTWRQNGSQVMQLCIPSAPVCIAFHTYNATCVRAFPLHKSRKTVLGHADRTALRCASLADASLFPTKSSVCLPRFACDRKFNLLSGLKFHCIEPANQFCARSRVCTQVTVRSYKLTATGPTR